MKITIDRSSNNGVYFQIYTQLRAMIVSGQIGPGEKLPSKREVSSELGVSLVTVEHAYALLCDEGYALSRERSGYYADFRDRPQKEPAPQPIQPPPSLVSAPEDFPFSVLSKTMRRVLSEYDRRILVKSPSQGAPELRQALCGYLLRTRGASVSPDMIIVGSGAEYLYSLIVQLLGRDRLYGLEDPCYGRIVQVYESNGAKCEKLPMGGDGILSQAMSESRADVLHVTPFSSYPSMITATASKRHEYVRWAKVRGAYLIEDDYDAEFAAPSKQADTLLSLAPEQVIYLNTFTKTLAPAIRTAYMVLPEELMMQYHERLDFYSCTVPVFEQFVLAEFIASGDLERYIARRRRKFRGK